MATPPGRQILALLLVDMPWSGRSGTGVGVMALITSSCQGALHGGWDKGLQHRALAVIFDGLRPAAANPASWRK
jgi:hypothetical protein